MERDIVEAEGGNVDQMVAYVCESGFAGHVEEVLGVVGGEGDGKGKKLS